MAQAVERNWRKLSTSCVITRYGHSADCKTVEVIEAAHPVPDGVGLIASNRLLKLANSLTADDFALCLISGGASSLLSYPDERIGLRNKQGITRQLLLSGAEISEINCVRKHLSAIKGGQLMRAIYPARALTLCISDVVGDDPSVIGSGPTVADATTCDDALNVIKKHQIQVDRTIIELLQSGDLETPKPGDAIFEHSKVSIIASSKDALQASAEFARSQGVEAVILGASVTGDSNQVAKIHAQVAVDAMRDYKTRGCFVLLSGGETTLDVTGSGEGGPNTQFVLALAQELNGAQGIHAIACDTDGIDGTGTNAGAVIGPNTLLRGAFAGMNAADYIRHNDSFTFFKKLGDLVEPGPTLTNVNDFRAILCDPGTGKN